MWALGVILYEMLVGRTCDQGLKMEAYLDMIKSSGIPLPPHLSPFSKHVLTKMLAFNHHMRSDCLQALKEFEAYQSSFQPFTSQAVFRSSQFNESVTNNDFYALRANKNNQVFKSMMLGQGQPPPQLLQSQMQPNILVHEVPTNIPPEDRNENQADKRFIKSNSARNVKNQIAFNTINNGHILGRVENVDGREPTTGKRMVEVKSSRPNLQTIPGGQLLDVSFPAQKVHFNVVPSHSNHR